MKIFLDQRKTAVQNAAIYYQETKRMREKARGAAEAAEQTKKQLQHVDSVEKQKQLSNGQTTVKQKQQWFDKFLHFHTSAGSLVVAGRNAKQNDLLFTKHSIPEEVFLHADIRGSPAVIVKTTTRPTEQELQEAAQFTACYSSAWKRGFGSVDVYAIKVAQVSKHFHGGYLEQGAFAISGERQWFKNTLLELCICFEEGKRVFALPAVYPQKPRYCIALTPGKLEKNQASKAIKLQLQKLLFNAGKKIRIEDEEIARLLPGGVELVS